MTDPLVQALLDKVAADPEAIERLRELLMPPTEPTMELLSLKAAAQIIGVSSKTVGRWIDAGILTAVIVQGKRKLRSDELRAYIDGLERDGARTPRRSRRRPPRDDPYDFLLRGT